MDILLQALIVFNCEQRYQVAFKVSDRQCIVVEQREFVENFF